MVAKKPPRGTAIVVSAIRKLRDIQGTSSRDIMNLISSEYNVSTPDLKRQVQMALKRGMSYGIINRGKGGYYLANPKSLTISCDTLVDRSRRGRRCKGRSRRRRRSMRRKCKRRGSRRSRRRRGRGKCRGKRRSMRRRRRGKRGCGRRGRRGRHGRRRGGDDEMDEMAVTLARGAGGGDLKKRTKRRRNKYEELRGSRRSKSPSNRSTATRSSEGSTPIDNPTQM